MSANKQTRHRKPRKPRSDFRRLGDRFMSGILRSLFFMSSTKRLSRAGFVLPTTVLLLLVVSLTVGALSFRTFSRTSQTIAYRDQQIVDSVAAPAIDRAKSKIEFLFTKDASVADKRPPSSTDLLNALRSDTYTLPKETREDLDPASNNDNAWSFDAPDGTKIVYSITLDDTHDNGTDVISIDGKNGTEPVDDQTKADNFIVRNGPIDTTTPTGSCPVARLAGNGWQLSGARLAKNIQVNVLAIKGTGPSKTVSAAEYQQVRTASRGNRWGAWFRYDMEIAPGSPLRWNGAMHTEGSLIAGQGFTAYMVSSPNSCVYDGDASVIEVSGSVDNDEDGNEDFLGQVVSGGTGKRANQGAFLNQSSVFHTDATAQDPTVVGGKRVYEAGIERLTATGTARDSVEHNNATTSPSDISQDPIDIFTQDFFSHTNESTWSRTNDWDTVRPRRVKNDDTGAIRPFLDDGYRADNRYGPKPAYNTKHGLFEKNDEAFGTPHKSGDVIDDNPVLIKNDSDTDDYGLDGYWERSASKTGLRLIVGQRLQLGNPFGWQANDPLYPPNVSFSNATSAVAGRLKGTAEMLQMRSLRDNLAAVQSMAIYHSGDPTTQGAYPLACIASTSHPGTQESLENSRTFKKNSADEWDIDFLTGHGTNGIEFTPPASSDFIGGIEAKWADALGNLAYFAGDPKGGAPSFPAVQGKVGQSDGVMHPYPYLSMWGDFSILRRIFAEHSPVGNYDNLSLADKSTIHTAACTLGMLAYNIQSVEDEYVDVGNSGFNSVGSLIERLMDGNFSNGEIGPDPVTNLCNAAGDPGCPSSEYVNGDSSTYDPDYYAQFTADQWVNALINNPGGDDTKIRDARLLAYRQQLQRDRTLGFIPSGTSVGLPGSGTGYTASTGTYVYPDQGGNGNPLRNRAFKTGCDPSTMLGNSTKSQLGLAMAFCSTSQGPKYPSLYYLFPIVDHDQDGADYHSQPTGESGDEFFSENITNANASNRYISQADVNGAVTYQAVDVSTIALTPRAPADWKLPKVDVTPGTHPNPGTFDFPESTTSSLSYSGSAASNPTGIAKNFSQNVIRVDDGTDDKFYRTALLDKAIMDGRELLSVRLMDLDINLLTANVVDSSASDPKAWIPQDSGIVYAFREDAVREDAIVRPYASAHTDAAAAWTTCRDFTQLTTNANCYMALNPTAATHDPPLNSVTGISPKPVDMFADPDRRPYGFRLINGKSLNRTAVNTNDPVSGMTFVTDNTAYIRGDFNLHAVKTASDLESSLLEEFKEVTPGDGNLLGTNFALFSDSAADEKSARQLFYGRSNLDPRFADPVVDNWRPVEIFADGITILSDLFVDGWIEDGFTTRSTTTRGNPLKSSSYLNFNRPWFDNGTWFDGNSEASHTRARWQHEDPEDNSTPIKVDRNGNVYRQPSGGGNYLRFPDQSGGMYLSFYRRANSDRVKQGPSVANLSNGDSYFVLRQSQQHKPSSTDPIRVNALLIGGIIPSRAGQDYGGLHNFPRLLEYWPSRNLIISGGFFQLNFSSQAVAQFDQDSWEPGTNASSANNLQDFIMDGAINTGSQMFNGFFYGSARRIWGYDVGFQYTPAGPISRRFVRLDRPRSEFYRELPVDDPYIKKMCTAVDEVAC
ncbi:MAG: hormogonium polysaccharide biosynthesis protein HpsA [Phormidesmis sp.]